MDLGDITGMPAYELYKMGQESLVELVEALAKMKIIRDTLLQAEGSATEDNLKRFNVDMQVLQAECILEEIFSSKLRKTLKRQLDEANETAEENNLSRLPYDTLKIFASELIETFLDENDIPVDHSKCSCNKCLCDHKESK